LALLAIVSCHKLESHLLFDNFKKEFGKNYENETEHEMRKYIFMKNLEFINKVNSDPTQTWTAGINEFADLMPSEFKKKMGYNRDLAFSSYKASLTAPSTHTLQNLPDEVDWRKKGVVSEVKDQQACGSCWAFSTTSTMESHIAIQTGTLLSFSEQQLTSCAPNPDQCGGTGGCEGSTQWVAFQYLLGVGATDEADYPYEGYDDSCDTSKVVPKATIDNFVRMPTNDYNAHMTTVATYGPIAISVAASAFQFYSSGVYNGNCGTTVNHAVVIVGYGVDPKAGPYWIIKNSWGKRWGEAGYIRVMRETSAADVKCGVDTHPEQGTGCKGGPTEISVCGICGIYSDSSYPTGGKLTGQ